MPKSILDPKFRYVPASRTDISATFRRIRAEQKRNALEAKAKVAHMKERKHG